MLFPPLLLYWDPQLLRTYTYILVPTVATGVPPVASCVWPYAIWTQSDGQILTYILRPMCIYIWHPSSNSWN